MHQRLHLCGQLKHKQPSPIKLKTALIEAPVLAYPDLFYLFLLDTDASNVGIGAVLSQVVEGKVRLCEKLITMLGIT